MIRLLEHSRIFLVLESSSLHVNSPFKFGAVVDQGDTPYKGMFRWTEYGLQGLES